jgi:hypothetical protein
MNLYTNRFKKWIIGLVFLLFKSQGKKSRLACHRAARAALERRRGSDWNECWQTLNFLLGFIAKWALLNRLILRNSL